MAILNKIRQKTVVLILVIALALFAFILSSLFDNKDALFSKSPDVVATINGEDVSRKDFKDVKNLANKLAVDRDSNIDEIVTKPKVSEEPKADVKPVVEDKIEDVKTEDTKPSIQFEMPPKEEAPKKEDSSSDKSFFDEIK